MHTCTAASVGFKSVLYDVDEEEDTILTFEVEVKTSAMFEIPIDFEVTDTPGEAQSVFYNSLVYCSAYDEYIYSFILGLLDYIGLGTLSLTIQPGQTSVRHNISIVNDEVTEVDEETFMLQLVSQTERVSVKPGFGSALVTITDDDGKPLQM